MPSETFSVAHEVLSVAHEVFWPLAIACPVKRFGYWVERNLWERRLAANDLLIGARRTSHKIHQHLTALSHA